MKSKNNSVTLTDLLAELMNSGGRQLYLWEIYLIYPISNQAQVLERGIREAVDTKNYICAASLLRSLAESTMALVYGLTIPNVRISDARDGGHAECIGEGPHSDFVERLEGLALQIEALTDSRGKVDYTKIDFTKIHLKPEPQAA